MNRKAFFLIWIIVLIFLVVACNPAYLPDATPIPTQQTWLISYPPELAWMSEEFTFCLETGWNTGIIVEEYQVLDILNNESDVIMTWGDVDPQGVNAFQVGTDQIRMVVNSEMQPGELSISKINDIYNGKIKDWGEIDEKLHGEIHGWTYPENFMIRQAFDADLGGLGKPSPELSIAPDVSAMIDAISGDTQSIGFVPAYWGMGGLNTIRVNDWVEEEIPIVAMTRTSNDAKLSSWLNCLMSMIEKKNQ